MIADQLKKFFTAKSKKSRGFTLVEVLVAISVIATVGFVPISIVTQHLVQNALTPGRVRADLLAQEVIEYVRYTRDFDVLSRNGGKWFKNLYLLDGSNPYQNCVVYVDDWAAGTVDTYCTVSCYADANRTEGVCGEAGVVCGECGTDNVNGFVAGVVETTGRTIKRVDSSETCDGKHPKGNNQFTTTVSVVVPREGSVMQYASVVPCISWEERNGSVRKVTRKETLFEWIQRVSG